MHTLIPSSSRPCPASLFLGVMITLTLVSTAAAQSFGNPGILPPSSSPNGKSYGQLTAAWWQWALAAPVVENPVLDTTGEFASVGQSGPVWFLGSTFGNSLERTFTVPQGKLLFLPVYQWIFGATVGDCDPSNPGTPCDVPTLRASAAAATTSAQTLEVSIDQVPVQNVRNYRAFSTDSFSITLPAGNVPEFFGLPTPAGTYSPHVADGYWLMLAPLSSGVHTIRVHVVPGAGFGSEYTVTYHLTVR